MTDIKFSLPGPETVTLSRQNVDKLIRAGDGDAALLYLYILKAHGQTSDQITLSDASTALGKDAGTIATAMAILSRLGLINKCDIHESDSKSPVNSPVEEPRQYTAHDVIRELEGDSHFPVIAKEAQQKLGRILSPEDLQRLLVMYDELRLPPEVILLLITHCISESRRRGGGRMPSMRYIEKAAFEWEREGIFSMEQAEEYLKNLENLKSARGMVKTALQIMEREQASEILESLDTLREIERSILTLRYYEDCSFSEISRRTGIKLNTVLTTHYRALEKLRPRLSKLIDYHNKPIENTYLKGNE